MSLGGKAIRSGCLPLPLALVAATVSLALVGAAVATADLSVTAIDCQGHPRKIAIVNGGDSAQDLTGWKLESDQPDEVFDLAQIGALGPGATVYVFNGHGAPEAPELVGGSWIYPWNPGSFDFALWEDGQDFIQIVDAGGNVVSTKPCPVPPATPTPEPQPQPTLVPSDTNPDNGSNQPDSNQADNTQTGGGSQTSTGSGNAALSSAQSRSAAGEVFGPPAPGAAAPLPAGGGPPLAAHSIPLSLMGILAGTALILGGVSLIRLALRRPAQDA